MMWSEARAQKALSPEEIKADMRHAEDVKWLEEVAVWLRSRPEVGTLNGQGVRMKFYVWPVGGEYREIPAFEEA